MHGASHLEGGGKRGRTKERLRIMDEERELYVLRVVSVPPGMISPLILTLNELLRPMTMVDSMVPDRLKDTFDRNRFSPKRLF